MVTAKGKQLWADDEDGGRGDKLAAYPKGCKGLKRKDSREHRILFPQSP